MLSLRTENYNYFQHMFKSFLSRVYTRTHVAGYKLHPLVAINMLLVLATKLLPVYRSSVAGYKRIQVDRDINETVIISPRYIQSTCIPNGQHVSGDICTSTYMYPDTCCSSGIQVSGRRMSWCKRGIIRAVMKNWY